MGECMIVAWPDGWPVPVPYAMSEDVRLDADARLMWEALAVTADVRGWTRRWPASASDTRVDAGELARRCQWTVPCCGTEGCEGCEPVPDVTRVRWAVDRLAAAGWVVRRRGGLHALPWVAEHIEHLAASGVLARPRGGWVNLPRALADADTAGAAAQAQHVRREADR